MHLYLNPVTNHDLLKLIMPADLLGSSGDILVSWQDRLTSERNFIEDLCTFTLLMHT